MTESKEIVSSVETHMVPRPSEDVVVLARNPEEMVHAQQSLLAWADSKIKTEQAQLLEAEENLAHAKSMKIRTEGWRRQVARANKRLVYYTKIQSALEEGYCIVPDFPIQVIASRTSKRRPKAATARYSERGLPDNKCETLPQGAGRYVDPRPFYVEKVLDEKTSSGGTRQVTTYATSGFDEEIDFPFKTVKPQVLSDLNRAMQLKIFDEIGVLPDTSSKVDPMIIGQIKRRDSTYQETTVSFLITWWVDSRDI